MTKIDPSNPGMDTLDVDERMAYCVSTETWQTIEFFLSILEHVEVANLGPEGRDCHFCGEPLTKKDHRAVRLPCNHYFGESCIREWLSLHATREPEAGEEWPMDTVICPICGQECFPEQTNYDVLSETEARLKLWDQAYEHVGIALSQRQSRAREDLILYLHHYPARKLDIYSPLGSKETSPYVPWAHEQLLSYCVRLKGKNLTPLQERLRLGLENVAIYGIHPLIQFEDSEPKQDDKSHKSYEKNEAEEESEELAKRDAEERRNFLAMFRWNRLSSA